MKIWETLPSSTMDAVKQAYRQGFDWRDTLARMHPDKDLDVVADAMERDYFPNLPRIVRHDKRGQPVPPKGGKWVDRSN
jgi:hypothetical protein